MKDPKKVAMGKKHRASGKAFELKIRHDLETRYINVLKNPNNVEFMNEMDMVKEGMKVVHEWYNGKIVPCKPKFNPFTHGMMMISGGFPDFIAIKLITSFSEGIEGYQHTYEVIGIEAKSNGTLLPIERAKCKWLIDNKIFSKVFIARKGLKRGEIIYEELKGGEL